MASSSGTRNGQIDLIPSTDIDIAKTDEITATSADERLRTVSITGLSADTAIYEIINQIRSGVITHVSQAVMGSKLGVTTVLITFLEAASAQHCIDHLLETGQTWNELCGGDIHAKIDPKPLRAFPLDDELRDLISTGTVSRILLITGLHERVTHKAIAEVLRNSNYDHDKGCTTHDILAIEDRPADEHHVKGVRVHFNSVKNAIRAFRVFVMDDFFLHCQGFFDPDPCDPQGRERQARQQTLPRWVSFDYPSYFPPRGRCSPKHTPRKEFVPTADGLAKWRDWAGKRHEERPLPAYCNFVDDVHAESGDGDDGVDGKVKVVGIGISDGEGSDADFHSCAKHVEENPEKAVMERRDSAFMEVGEVKGEFGGDDIGAGDVVKRDAGSGDKPDETDRDNTLLIDGLEECEAPVHVVAGAEVTEGVPSLLD